MQALNKTRSKYTFKTLRSYTIRMFSSFLFCKNVTSYNTNLRIICQSQVKNVKYTNRMLHKVFQGIRNNAFNIANVRKINEKTNIDVPKLVASIQNNVILYKYEKTNQLIMLKLIFYGWLCNNIVLLFVTYDSKYIRTWSKHKSWLEYIKEHGTNLLFFFYSISIGPISLLMIYQFNKRIIRYIILHKGGTLVSLITSHVYKKNYTLTVPTEKVKVTVARADKRIYLPLKIQNKKLYYLVSGDGKFYNHALFDYTLGAAKTW